MSSLPEQAPKPDAMPSSPPTLDEPEPRASSEAPAAPKRSHKRSASSVSIADSPLQQMNLEPAQQFKLKVFALYEQLFQTEQHSPGYWVEFFLLPVNTAELTRVTRAAQPLSRHEATVQVLVRAAVANLNSQLPTDIVLNALKVLEVVFEEALDLAVKTPTTRVIQVLAGLDRASRVFDDLTSEVLKLLQHRSLAVVTEATRFVLVVARRSLGTQLNTLFATKNFFAALIRVIDDYIEHEVAVLAFTAIGVLTALNIYDDDGAPVYKQRVSDYVDDSVMSKIIALVQRELSNNTPNIVPAANGGGIGGWFGGWFARSPSPPQASPRPLDSEVLGENIDGWQVLLSLYLFVQNNSIFAQSFASSPGLVALMTHCIPVLENAPKSRHDHSRAWLVVLVLRRLCDTEFLTLVDPAVATTIRIEAPKLALDTSRRAPLAGVLDIVQVGLKIAGKNGDAELLQELANVLYQVCLQTLKTKTMWQYDWPQLWRTAIGTVKHLSTRKEQQLEGTSELAVHRLLDVLVGMSLHRDVLDEEDWAFLMFRIVQNTKLFATVAQAFPNLASSAAIRAARSMIGQYELNPESPDFAVIIRQGNLAVGTKPLIGETLRPFSVHHEPLLKQIIKLQIKNAPA